MDQKSGGHVDEGGMWIRKHVERGACGSESMWNGEHVDQGAMGIRGHAKHNI